MENKDFEKWERDNQEDLVDEKKYLDNLNKVLSQPWWYFLVYILIFLIFLAGLLTIFYFFGIDL